MIKKNKGITLISLVITIIVLLIIVSVSTASGIGAVRYMKFNNAKTQFQVIQSQVNSWYEEAKDNPDVLTYGTENLNTLDVKTVSDTINYGTGSNDATGYRYFSSNDITDKFDIDGISHDFLINISTRTVLLYGGITYQNKKYYNAKDFGINVIEYEELSSDITFDTKAIDGYIIVYNIQFSEDIDISKYSVQYQEYGDTHWTTLTSDMKGSYEYENSEGETIIDENAWYINIPKLLEIPDIPYILGEKYNVKIITSSNQISSEEVLTRSLNWEGFIMKSKKKLKDDDENEVVVPEGFYITSKLSSKVDSGVVVTAPDGSEFVWIPVENAVYDSENENSNQIPTSPTSGTLKEYTYTPMAIQVDGEYKGILYDYDFTGGAYLKYPSAINYQGTTSEDREPDYLTDETEGDVSTIKNQGLHLLSSIIRNRRNSRER